MERKLENTYSFFQSVTFTNGGMRYSLTNFRLSQILLKTPVVGEVFNSLLCKLPQEISRNKSAIDPICKLLRKSTVHYCINWHRLDGGALAVYSQNGN